MSLQVYFEATCGTLLLYKQERQQVLVLNWRLFWSNIFIDLVLRFKEKKRIMQCVWARALASTIRSVGDLYCHSLSLIFDFLVKLPSLLTHANLDERSIAHLTRCLQVQVFLLQVSY